jgi:N-acetylglucosaminyldiphosphoundecaprenol N-acetyl-beta-D-mannosaminyltransferase
MKTSQRELQFSGFLDSREKFVHDVSQVVEGYPSGIQLIGTGLLLMKDQPRHRFILGMRVDYTTYPDATQRVLDWAKAGEHRAISLACVNNVMESHSRPEFRAQMNSCDLVTSDGQPLAWALRLMGIKGATRVYGPDLTLWVCEAAAKEGVPIGLYGGTPESLREFVNFLRGRYPGIQIACRIAPAFRPLTQEEDDEYTRQIVDSGARILFVGIGCPKQETWMVKHRERIPAAILSVGAAFDFHSGRVTQAPRWMMKSGLEWFFRLVVEPKRLWKRYIFRNPAFVALFTWQLLTTSTEENS